MLEVCDIQKTYEGRLLLRGVSFSVDAGETICLLGASGSGKSTLLRIIAGLETAEVGQVLWNGKSMMDVPVHQRGFGLMFQDYALFPHRTVAENIAFGLRMQAKPKAEIQVRVTELLRQVNLDGFGRRRVTDLSGGEQQRVALARALAPHPRLLMLDEPLGALDRALREQLGEELRRVLHRTSIPAVYVTHDQQEAFTIADRLVLLHDGSVVQQGIPAEIYAHPASLWVASFLGLNNLLEGRVMQLAPLVVETCLGSLYAVPATGRLPRLGEQVTLLLRPGAASLCTAEGSVNCLEGLVEDGLFFGDGYRLDLRAAPELVFSFTLNQPAPVGSKVKLSLDPQAVLLFEEVGWKP